MDSYTQSMTEKGHSFGPPTTHRINDPFPMAREEFDSSIGDIFHALVKAGGRLMMHNGHVAGPRPHIHHTVMPNRGDWLPPMELVEAIKDSRWLEWN